MNLSPTTQPCKSWHSYHQDRFPVVFRVLFLNRKIGEIISLNSHSKLQRRVDIRLTNPASQQFLYTSASYCDPVTLPKSG